MKFLDISQDVKGVYRLKVNERGVFFMLNRSGEVTFDMSEAGAEAHIFSFFLLQNSEPQKLHIIQRHRGSGTLSKVLVKAALTGASSLSSTGLIKIEKSGNLSEAYQESRALLLSKDAQMHALPSLEILAPDVRCHHAATASPLNKEALFFAETRGLSPEQSQELLVRGFFQEAIERIEDLGASKDALKMIEQKISPLLENFS